MSIPLKKNPAPFSQSKTMTKPNAKPKPKPKNQTHTSSIERPWERTMARNFGVKNADDFRYGWFVGTFSLIVWSVFENM